MVLFQFVEVEVHSSVSRLVLTRRMSRLAWLLQLILVDVAVELAVETGDHLLRLGFAEKVAVRSLPPAYRVKVVNVEIGLRSLFADWDIFLFHFEGRILETWSCLQFRLQCDCLLVLIQGFLQIGISVDDAWPNFGEILALSGYWADWSNLSLVSILILLIDLVVVLLMDPPEVFLVSWLKCRLLVGRVRFRNLVFLHFCILIMLVFLGFWLLMAPQGQYFNRETVLCCLFLCILAEIIEFFSWISPCWLLIKAFKGRLGAFLPFWVVVFVLYGDFSWIGRLLKVDSRLVEMKQWPIELGSGVVVLEHVGLLLKAIVVI